MNQNQLLGTIQLSSDNTRLETLIADLIIEQKKTNDLLTKLTTGQVKDTLQNKETAAFLGIAPATLYDMVSEKRVPFHKSGNKNVFFRVELEQYLHLLDSDNI